MRKKKKKFRYCTAFTIRKETLDALDWYSEQHQLIKSQIADEAIEMYLAARGVTTPDSAVSVESDEE
ncbi:hypothetical protein H6F89_33925 [Cyanobacteria bacterium FACHB-63]|nr:hypothetical protein [Cyanobacteria bacterium FACHB-63]